MWEPSFCNPDCLNSESEDDLDGISNTVDYDEDRERDDKWDDEDGPSGDEINKEQSKVDDGKENLQFYENNREDSENGENNMYMEEINRSLRKVEEGGGTRFDIGVDENTQVEESIGIIKNTNVAEEQNEEHISPKNEVNKDKDQIGEEVGDNNSGHAKQPVNPFVQSGCWPPLGDMADHVDLSSNSQYGPIRVNGPLAGSPQSHRRPLEVAHECMERNEKVVIEDSKSTGGALTEDFNSNSQDCDEHSLDLNSDPIELIEEQFLRHKNNDRKGKKSNKQTLGMMSLKLKDVVRANSIKKQKKPHKSQSANQSPNKSLNLVSMELELTKKIGFAVGFNLDGHEHMLRSEIEGEGVNNSQK
ncbi:hypothetical protein L2E82_37149 [Cichorium intybus]|uniref:Uncharacterized protein n=1 Tax=Cichorium intybus TaxID=13427 RepID=A0ACB9ADR6_CICIN|nr:hypothetical protein L2E82_37149 [Cichorium intybus]